VEDWVCGIAGLQQSYRRRRTSRPAESAAAFDHLMMKAIHWR